MRLENLDFSAELDRIIEQNSRREIRPSLLLHCCCAPCSTFVLEYLAPHFDITALFFNPNIMPKEEYDRRLAEQLWLCGAMGIGHIETDYNNQMFLDAVRGLEGEPEGGKRCEACIRLRLDKTAKTARAGEFNYFGTTLTVSPHKNAEFINKTGKQMAIKYNLIFLPSDFKKKDGFKKSIELSKKYNLYRQDYCGCKF